MNCGSAITSNNDAVFRYFIHSHYRLMNCNRMRVIRIIILINQNIKFGQTVIDHRICSANDAEMKSTGLWFHKSFLDVELTVMLGVVNYRFIFGLIKCNF